MCNVNRSVLAPHEELSKQEHFCSLLGGLAFQRPTHSELGAGGMG